MTHKIQSIILMQFLIRKVSHSNGNFKLQSHAHSVRGNMVLSSLLPSYKMQTQEIKHIISSLAYICQLEVMLFLGKNHVTFFTDSGKITGAFVFDLMF